MEIQKAFPNFDRRRLVEWQQKGYIEHIKRGFYRFKDQPITEGLLYFTANKIYSHSYLSLETALANYQIIPEAVFTFTNITTLNTSKLTNELGSFTYRHVKSNLFFGYRLLELTILIFPLKNLQI